MSLKHKSMAPLRFFKHNVRLLSKIIGTLFLAGFILLIGCYTFVGTYKKYIYTTSTIGQKNIKVGIVFGSGINHQSKPYKELQSRLDIAAQALQDGVVQELILSGDNRFLDYNEPDAMIDYLVNTKHIPQQKLQADYAGRSTYESCERAAKIFSLKQVVLFSARSHLPRAIFLCRHFGVQSYGIASSVEANNANRREPLARIKAVLNAYIIGEKTILGDKITL